MCGLREGSEGVVGKSDELVLPQYLNSTKLAAWIEEIRPDYRVYGGSVERAMWRWKNECEHLHYEKSVDRHMTTMDLHEWEIPDDCWEREFVHNGGFQKSSRRIEVEGLLLEGHMPIEIREHFRQRDEWIEMRQINRWRRELDKAGKL